MDKYVKKYLSKDEAEFLKPSSTNPFEDGDPSGHGANAKFDDAGGVERGEYGFGRCYDDYAFCSPSQRKTDRDVAHEKLAGLLDDSQPYDPLLPGGAPLTKGKGVGSGPPKVKPKTGPRQNGGL
jgi:hypothetical protein